MNTTHLLQSMRRGGGIQLSWTFCKETLKLYSHVVKMVHNLDLSTTLMTEQSFSMSLVSSQLGEVASGGLRVEMGRQWLTRSIQEAG